MDKRIGITTTLPVEAIFAAGYTPVDLNNIFITSEENTMFLEEAEKAGFPRAYCAWIKGIYGAIKRSGIRKIIGVTRGDCSDTHALCEILENESIEVIPFAYPEKPDVKEMKCEIEKLCISLGTTLDAAEEKKNELDKARKLIMEIDKLAYEENTVTGTELFDLQINSSDFKGDPKAYAEKCRGFLDEIKKRKPFKHSLRIGMAGIPPAFSDLVSVMEQRDAAVIFQQIPRQFSLPFIGEGLAESYSKYTYPYAFEFQLRDIIAESENRRLDGIVHYVQSFCHRQLYDKMLRKKLEIPVLSIEGDRPSMVDNRTLTRIEAFFETILF